MKLNDNDLEKFEDVMNRTARDHGMNLAMCTDKGKKRKSKNY